MIPNIAKPGDFEADLKLETGNYKSMRASGMVNIPLGDTLAVRAAGAWTSRDGYDFNTVTNRRVNGRDLWSTRISAAWELHDRFPENGSTSCGERVCQYVSISVVGVALKTKNIPKYKVK